MAQWLNDVILHVEGVCASIEHSTPGMMALGAAVTVANFAVWRALRRRVREAFPDARKAAHAFDFAFWLPAAPMAALAIGGQDAGHSIRAALPVELSIAAMVFQLAVLVYGAVLMAARLLPRLNRGEMDPQRRLLLKRASLAVPAAILTTAAAGGVASRQAPVVNTLRQPVRGDYGALRGLRIAQFSDVHIGSLLERDRLDEVTERMNSLKPDIVVCTGDLIDDRIDQLELAQVMLRSLNPRVGTFMCMGNHEYIAAQGDEAGVRGGLRDGGAMLLVDESIKLEVNGTHLWLAGTDFPGTPCGALGRRPSIGQSLDRALAGMRDDGAPRILLSHHPRTFFEGREREIDLMLSGHTHGGQIKLGRIGDYALTPNLPFEFYHKGLYEHEGRRLYVNSGIGSWLPVRINVPPEITLIELV